MKFTTETRTRLVPRTIGGVTHQVRESYTVQVPVPPRDWDTLAIRVASGLVMALTAVAVVWSTYSIGALLHGGVGYAAACIFDVAWAVNVLLEWLSRFDVSKRAFSKKLGWGLLAATMGAIFWHGLGSGGVAMGVVGAAVSLFAKVLWMGIMRFIDRDLSSEDAQWVAAEVSRANVTLALAGVRRQVSRVEDQAAGELLAAEHVRGRGSSTAEHVRGQAEQFAGTGGQAEQFANTGEHAGTVGAGRAEQFANMPLNSANTVPDVRDWAVPSLAELAREQVASGVTDREAVAAILAVLPGVKPGSVAATVRRERRRQQRQAMAVPGYL